MGGAPNSDTVVAVRPVRRANLPAGIAAELRGRILRGELQPGARLPGHRELAAMYAVSVGSVREAISMLVSARLVETRAGSGTFVVDGGSLSRGRGPRAAADASGGRGAGRGPRADRVRARRARRAACVVGAARRARAGRGADGSRCGQPARLSRRGRRVPPRCSPRPRATATCSGR